MGMGSDWGTEEDYASALYWLEGAVTVKDNDSTRKLLEELENACDIRKKGIEAPELIHYVRLVRKKSFELRVNGYTYCSPTGLWNIERILGKFGAHLSGKVGYFEAAYGGEDHYELWIGPPEAVEKAQAERDMEDAREAIRLLTKEQVAQLLQEMRDPQFFAPDPKPQR